MLKNCAIVIRPRSHWYLLWTFSRSSSTNLTQQNSDGHTSASDININRERSHQKMKGWQIHEYGDVDVLQLNKNIKIPVVKDPNEVLIQVESTSLNPIDVAMMSMLK